MEFKRREEHVFRSTLPDIDIPNHLPIQTYCFQNLCKHSSRPAIINASTGEIFTHAAVHLAARRVAVGFHSLGIGKGHIVMLLLHNSPEFAFAFLAASFLGATATTANPLYTASEIENQARISKPNLIITHACYAEKVIRFASEEGARIVTIDRSRVRDLINFSELVNSDEKLLPVVEIDAEDTAAMLFSSGTTGLPKAVMLSHKNMVTCIAKQVDGENPSVYIDPQDVSICVLPLFHAYSLNSILLCNLRAGAAVVLMRRFEIHELMELIQRYRVTLASFVPPILLAMAKNPAAASTYDLSSLRRVVCGAAPMNVRLVIPMKALLHNAVIAQAYGMTEVGVISTSSGFAKIPQKFKAGSCGSIIRNTLMKVADPLTGASLPRNQPGEICVKSDNVMKGYFNDPEATRRTIDEEGWLHTGDIGYVDDDNEVFIVDRLKELIKHKGFHIAPAELEALLINHPFIYDAAVVPMKDEFSGEVPVAFVVRSPNGSNISENEIKQFISNQVVPYKQIHHVFFIEEIPKAPSGKILRKNLRSRI